VRRDLIIAPLFFCLATRFETMRLFNKTQSDAQPETLPEILIVEDDEMQALFLKAILEHNNFRVTVAQNGHKAWLMLNKGKTSPRPIMVISDIMMPEMNGYELCRKIKEADLLKGLPVMLITSLTDPNEVVKGLYAGADSLIAKPYDEQFLLGRIESIRLNQMAQHRHDPETGEETGMRISIGGEKFTVTQDRLQTVELLLSSYEIAVRKNQQLTEAKRELEQKQQELDHATATIERLQREGRSRAR
jgi:DNA-binding response OmpR family regulator